MPALNSSNLASYDYDPDTAVLKIQFVSGRTYTYADVPPDVADGLGSASSPGQYFNSAIKDQYRVG